MRAFVVPPEQAPLRLDVFLARAVPHGSRRLAQRAIAAGEVRVNGRWVRKSGNVTAGDTVEVADHVCASPALAPNPVLAVPILYEDAALVVLDKPAGMPSHALRPEETDTVANFLLARFPDVAAVGAPLEPGIVHRLDTETSGVLLVARTPEAHAALRRQFAEHRVLKEYRAVVHGDVATAGELRTLLAHDHHNRRKMRIVKGGDDARPAITSYRPLERYGAYTELEVHIATGVMHQIRVHLAALGHSVVGDRLYGSPAPLGPASPGDPARHLLHASRLGFTHPTSGQVIEVRGPLPADFAAFLEMLRAQR